MRLATEPMFMMLPPSGSDRPTSSLNSRSVRCDELNFRSFTPTFGSTTKLQHIRLELLVD